LTSGIGASIVSSITSSIRKETIIMENEKVRENRLRRMAQRQALTLRKIRRRDPRAVDYGRYRIVDPYNSDGLVFPIGTGAEWGATLDEIEAYLTQPVPQMLGHASMEKRSSDLRAGVQSAAKAPRAKPMPRRPRA
jgi:hypothetical protein